MAGFMHQLILLICLVFIPAMTKADLYCPPSQKDCSCDVHPNACVAVNPEWTHCYEGPPNLKDPLKPLDDAVTYEAIGQACKRLNAKGWSKRAGLMVALSEYHWYGENNKVSDSATFNVSVPSAKIDREIYHDRSSCPDSLSAQPLNRDQCEKAFLSLVNKRMCGFRGGLGEDECISYGYRSPPSRHLVLGDSSVAELAKPKRDFVGQNGEPAEEDQEENDGRRTALARRLFDKLAEAGWKFVEKMVDPKGEAKEAARPANTEEVKTETKTNHEEATEDGKNVVVINNDNGFDVFGRRDVTPDSEDTAEFPGVPGFRPISESGIYTCNKPTQKSQVYDQSLAQSAFRAACIYFTSDDDAKATAKMSYTFHARQNKGLPAIPMINITLGEGHQVEIYCAGQNYVPMNNQLCADKFAELVSQSMCGLRGGLLEDACYEYTFTPLDSLIGESNVAEPVNGTGFINVSAPRNVTASANITEPMAK